MKKVLTAVILSVLAIFTSDYLAYGQSPTISTGYGQWKKMYFVDDFNDPMYDHPYIQTYLKNENHFLYICFTPEHGGVINFNIQEDFTHNKTRFIGPITLSIKKADGIIEKFNIPLELISGGEIFLPGADVLRFANAINNGNCKISFYGQTSLGYSNTPSNFVFSSTNQTKNLLQAIQKEFNLSPSTSYNDEEFMTHSMGDFCGTYTLKGKIDGKYAVTMTLTFDYGSVTGTYYYDKYKIKNKIDGMLARLGPMILTEYDGNKETGEYDGEFNGKVFRGEFVNYASGKRMPFLFTVQ